MNIKIAAIYQKNDHLESIELQVINRCNLGNFIIKVGDQFTWLPDYSVNDTYSVRLVKKNKHLHASGKDIIIPCLYQFYYGKEIVLIQAKDWQFAEKELWK